MMLRILFTLAAVTTLSYPSAARDNDLESWYTYWGLGYANNTYPEELQNDLDEFNDFPGVDHIALALDTFGFYWPRGNRTLVGGIVNGNADVYEATENLVTVEIDIYNYLYAISAMHFLTHEIGQGPFVRADVGLARQSAEVDLSEANEVAEIEIEATSDWGTGFLLGGGYGIPVTSGTRLLVNANFSLRRIEGEQIKSVGITLNGLF